MPTAARRPEPTCKTQEGGFATSGGANNQQTLARFQADAEILDQNTVALRRDEIDVAEQQAAAFDLHGVGTTAALLFFAAVGDLINPALESFKAGNAG